MEVWTNADKPEEAAQARGYGAQGIGLCRTEHMFREGDRLEIVRGAILVANEATRAKAKAANGGSLLAAEQEAVSTFDAAMAKLETLQQGDFEGIFKAMDGLPVVIRLIDPPLHEFLPDQTELAVRVALEDDHGHSDRKHHRLLDAVGRLHEQNPMLGLRGVRLGIAVPGLFSMQTRAVLEASADRLAAGGDPRPEIMVPLVATANELTLVRREILAVVDEVQAERGMRIPVRVGTMIEVPRAALTADRIATAADFFSFGTNDLTQMTWGFSRDDVEAAFFPTYLDQGVFPVSPFESLDVAGVGSLVATAVRLGREANPALHLGVCGEHGGDPESIHFFEDVGLDYVSCSPFRVPVARLEAARAVLARGAGGHPDRSA